MPNAMIHRAVIRCLSPECYRKTIIKQGTIWNPDTFGRFGESSPVPVVCFGAGRYSLTTDYDCKHSDNACAAAAEVCECDHGGNDCDTATL